MPAGNAFIQALAKVAGPQVIEVWPENWPAFQLFQRISSQWDVGMAGPTCLKYSSLYPLLDRLAADEAAWWALFDDIRHMESAALEAMRGE